MSGIPVPANAAYPISERPEMSNEVMSSQSRNARFPREVIVEVLSVVSCVHPLKAVLDIEEACGALTVVREVHPENEPLPKLVTLAKVTVSRAVQALKQDDVTELTLGRLTETSEVQLLNEEVPRLVMTLESIEVNPQLTKQLAERVVTPPRSMLVRFLHPLKQDDGREVTVDGKVTVVMVVLLLNAADPMAVTLYVVSSYTTDSGTVISAVDDGAFV